MKLNPTGYYIRVSVEDIEEVSEHGIILASAKDLQLQQDGHDVGILEAIGPLAFTGMRGIDDELDSITRAEKYGVKVGDRIQFNRYDGKVPRHAEKGNYRMIQDQHVIGVYGDE